MCVVTANASALVVGLPRALASPRVLVAELDVLVHEIADGLDPRPARLRLAEQAPSLLGQSIGFAVAAAEQEDQRFLGQILERDLRHMRHDLVR